MMRTVAVIPAAGAGVRLAAGVAKQFLELAGIPILARTLLIFENNPLIDGIILAVAPQQRQTLQEVVLSKYGCSKLLQVVDGGRERQQSVASALRALPEACELVVIHDAVRPLLSEALLSTVVRAARDHAAAMAAIPARDTVKQVLDGRVQSTLDREMIWLAQTPQAFAAGLIRLAHQEAERHHIVATDDAALVERLGVEVRVVPGSADNIKLTTVTDVMVAETLLVSRGRGQAAGSDQ